MDIEFLTLDEILYIHQDQIKRYGGSAGIHDIGLLESAVAIPQAGFDGSYSHGDIFQMAAAYLFHIVKNHPFIDGNKRVGTVSALVFLAINDIDVQVDSDSLADFSLSVAQGKISKTAISEFLCEHVT